jgi:hypothetical protein
MPGERARPTRSTRRGIWPQRDRFGPGPLRARTTDRVEDLVAWLLVSLGLLAAFGAVLVGHAAYGTVLIGGPAGHVTAVRAVLLADAPPAPNGTPQAPSVRQSVPAVWTAADGAERTVELVVDAPLPAGTEVTAWVDRQGQVVTRPAGQPSEAAAFGIGAALALVALAWTLLGVTWREARRIVARRNAAAWAREWALVEPVWSGQVR